MRKIGVFIVALGLVAAACNGPEAGTTTTTRGTGSANGGGGTVIAEPFHPDQIQFLAALERFDACDAVLEHFKAEALARVGPYGLGGGPVYHPFAFAERLGVDDAAAIPATTVAAAGEGGLFSGTNVQVAGVDEPDIVKTDGDLIVTVVDGALRIVDADERQLLGSTHLDGWDHKIFLFDDTAVVFARGDAFVGIPEPLADAETMPAFTGPATLLHIVDLSDPADPSLRRTVQVEGDFLSARAIDGTTRIVMSSYPNDLPFVYPSNPAAEESAEATNRRVIEQSTLDDWLPNYTAFSADGDVVDEGLWVECERMHRPAEFAGFDTLSVATLAAPASDAGAAAGVVARGETVYASAESLYVATNVWVPEELVGDSRLAPVEQDYSTAIHKFDITGPQAEYLASGAVEGHLLNQFSMDEHDGFLRIATTQGAPWGFNDDSESFITALQERNGELEQVGRVGEMGRGERIFSVRFIGEAAYVVTFRQIDPLYVVDLRDPEAPAVTGELKIPGYSAYLHPLGEGMLLGVGQDADEDGFTRGAKVSLFDVSDPANPVEVSVWTDADSYTEAEWDHHAFLYWAATQTMVMPLQNWSDGFFGAIVLKTDDGLREQGRIEHGAVEGPSSDCAEIDPTDFGAGVGEIEPGLIIQLCGSDEVGGVPGHYCEVIPTEDLAFFLEEAPDEAELLEELVGEGDRLEVCWPDFGGEDPILRSFVIDDGLWTLSRRSLQVNDLATLEVLGTVGLA